MLPEDAEKRGRGGEVAGGGGCGEKEKRCSRPTGGRGGVDHDNAGGVDDDDGCDDDDDGGNDGDDYGDGVDDDDDHENSDGDGARRWLSRCRGRWL